MTDRELYRKATMDLLWSGCELAAVRANRLFRDELPYHVVPTERFNIRCYSLEWEGSSIWDNRRTW